jgi:hypothetical protein
MNANPNRRRYIVSIRHGEIGSVAWVMDTETQECLLSTSTIRDGAAWRIKAEREAERANMLNAYLADAEARRMNAERSTP